MPYLEMLPLIPWVSCFSYLTVREIKDFITNTFKIPYSHIQYTMQSYRFPRK